MYSLGESWRKNFGGIADLNDVPLKEARYCGYGSYTNTPWGASAYPFLLDVESYYLSGNYITKQTITSGYDGKTYIRRYSTVSGTEGWSAWKEI